MKAYPITVCGNVAYTDGITWKSKDPALAEFLNHIRKSLDMPRLMHTPDKAYYVAERTLKRLKEYGFWDAERHSSFNLSRECTIDCEHVSYQDDYTPFIDIPTINPAYSRHIMLESGIKPVMTDVISPYLPVSMQTAFTAVITGAMNQVTTSIQERDNNSDDIISELDIYFTATKPLPSGLTIFTPLIADGSPGDQVDVPEYITGSLSSKEIDGRYCEIHADGFLKGAFIDDPRYLIILNRGMKYRIDAADSIKVVLTPVGVCDTPDVKVTYAPSPEAEEVYNAIKGHVMSESDINTSADAYAKEVDDRLARWRIMPHTDLAYTPEHKSWFTRSKEYVKRMREFIRQAQHETLSTGTVGHLIYRLSGDATLDDETVQSINRITIYPVIDWYKTHLPQKLLDRILVTIICQDEDGRSAMVGYDEYQEIYLKYQAYDDPSVLAHEMGHVIEMCNMGVRQAVLRFLAFRAGSTRLIRMSDAYPDWGYGEDEMAYPDHFPNPYCGKIYDDMSTELISMGIEYMFRDPATFMVKDPEYFMFMVDVIKGRY